MKVTATVDGRTVSWEDGRLSGDDDMVRSAHEIMDCNTPTPNHLVGYPWNPFSPYAAASAFGALWPMAEIVESPVLARSDEVEVPDGPQYVLTPEEIEEVLGQEDSP